MQFIDLAAQQERIREKIESNIKAVLNHGQYVFGPEIKKLEERLAEYVGIDHAVACGSGTDALLLALMAYDVGPGDAIFTTPFTFFATAEVISLLGATPIFVDIDPKTFNMDPEHLERALLAFQKGLGDYPLPSGCTESSLVCKGIIAVDLFGLPADYDRINAISKKHGLFVIEDAAQSFGAKYKGKRACSLADIACTSFFPAKPLGAYGDGGMCFVDNEPLALVIRSFRDHGQGTNRYDNVRIGINGRMDSIQAAILHAKFDIFPDEVEKRQKVSEKYTELLSGLDMELATPIVPPQYQSVWAQYSILPRDETQRSELQSRLQEAEIPTAVYYPKPLHLQPAFRDLGYREGDFPVSEDHSRRVFSLPMHPYLKPDEQELIAEIIGKGKGSS